MVAKLTNAAKVPLKGGVLEDTQLSGVAAVGDFLVVGADEGHVVEILRPKGGTYRPHAQLALSDGRGEIDVESVAADGSTVYALGSHAATRKKPKGEFTAAEYRESLTGSDLSPSRDVVARFTLDDHGQPSGLARTTLRPFLDADRVLMPFTRIPTKENGVDLEGIAFKNDKLFIGFRGPVLRDNFVPVLVCAFATPAVTAGELRFLDLGGRGVRDLAATRDGFLVLAGPSGGGPGSYLLYFWDGLDCLPGRRDGPRGTVTPLGRVPSPAETKPEGVCVLRETDRKWDVLVLRDGAAGGGVRRYEVQKP